MEWFNEVIGFLIILFVFMVPLIRKLFLKKKEPEPVEYEEEEMEEEWSPPPLPSIPSAKPIPTTERLVKRDFEFHADIEDRALHSRIEDRAIGTRVVPEFKKRIVSEAFILAPKKKRRRQKSVLSIIDRKDPLQAMVILSEVFGPPKSVE